jgi:hypothetical protein
LQSRAYLNVNENQKYDVDLIVEVNIDIKDFP